MSAPRRLLFLATFGLGGLILLLYLGFWQLDRLSWKQALIAEMTARGQGAARVVDGEETQAAHDHRAAEAVGRYADEPPLRYLTSKKGLGPGFRLIHAFALENGRRILVDRGFAPEAAAPRGGAAPAPPPGEQRLSGRLRWPRETSWFSPEPNAAERLWFARDVAGMAEALGAAPVMLVLGPETQAAPVADVATRWPRPEAEAVDLPNNHLGYAVTWFALAAIWLVMSALLGFRKRA